MAILIPEVPKDCPNSERHIYSRLGSELPDDWVVLHSLGLANHPQKIWGEADIVILSGSGIFALEVKGGKVRCSDGIWTFSGDFKEYTKRESPWQQAMDSLGAIRGQLRDTDSVFHDVLFGFGVVMPFTEFTSSGPEIVSEILLDRRTFRQPLRLYISSLERYWKAEYLRKHQREYRNPTPAELRKARQILRPDLETVLCLGGYLTGLDEHIVQLTNEQIRASRRMVANPRTVVRGGAGTGKTVIAIDRAHQLATEGHRVLYLCFNRLLAAHHREGFERSSSPVPFEIYSVHALYRELIEKAGLIPVLESESRRLPDFFSKRFPEITAEALCQKGNECWDVLIVDEAQDLLTPEHLDVFDLLLKKGLLRGCWHLFLDPRQNIYSVDDQSTVEKRLAESAPTFDDLHENCRNTRQVAVQTSIVSGIDLATSGAPDGLKSEVHYYSTQEEAPGIIESLIERLIASHVRPKDIAILSTRKHENSLLADHRSLAGCRLADPMDTVALRKGELLFTTMHAFKGLERQVVISIDMAEIGDSSWAMLHYAGLSRARGLLYVVLPTSTKAVYNRQASKFGQRLEPE